MSQEVRVGHGVGEPEDLSLLVDKVNEQWSRVNRGSPRAKDSIPLEVAEALDGWVNELLFHLDRSEWQPAMVAAGNLLHQLEHAVYFVDKIDSGGPRGNSGTGARIAPWKHHRRTF